MKRISIKDLTIIAACAAILFVLEQLLSFLPNIQLTVFLIVLFSKKLGFIKTAIIVIIHTVLDNLVMGSFNIMYFPFMLIGWLMIPILLSTLFKRCESPIILALLGLLFSFVYSWLYIIPNVIILDVDPLAYFISDFIFEIILAASSFLSILWLYKPCARILDYLTSKNDAIE